MAPMLSAIVLATATGTVWASDAECENLADEATLLQAQPLRRHFTEEQHSDAYGPLVILHWNGGQAQVQDETTCVSSRKQIETLGVPNDQMTGISGLRAGCSVKLFEHSRHCRATESAEDNCDDQACLTIDSNTMDLRELTGKVSGITVTCNPEAQYRCLQQYNHVFQNAGRSKCNFNEGVIYVSNRAECEAHALANDHGFYSFRHNVDSTGRHKCFSSETCEASNNMEGKLIGDRTNDWNVYANPSMPATQVGVYVGCYVDDPDRDMGEMQGNRDNAGSNTWVNCMSTCACQGKMYFSLQWGGECFCSNSIGNGPQYVRVADSECDVQREPCSSNAFNCGGTWRQAIYRIAPSPEHKCEGVYEAEEATISGAVVHANVDSDAHQGFTGQSFVDYLHRNDDYVEWTLDDCSGGPATAKFRYALSSGNRPLELIVNGNTIDASLDFNGCGENNWRTYCDVSAEVELSPGTNTIKLLATGSSGANMDHLEVRRHWH